MLKFEYIGEGGSVDDYALFLRRHNYRAWVEMDGEKTILFTDYNVNFG